MYTLARWCFRHRWIVLAGWLALVVATVGASAAAGTDFATRFQLPHTQSAEALKLLQQEFPAASGGTDQIVLAARSGQVTDPTVEGPASAMLQRISQLPHVRAVVSPFGGRADQVSRDGRIAFATVVFDGQPGTNPKADVEKVIRVAQGARSPSLQVALAGQDIENAQAPTSGSSTGFGILFALVVLLIAFGALFAATLPIITALFAIIVGYSLTGMLSHVMAVANFATILGVLIGLGVGVDYALFIVTRHRSALKAGADPETAAVGAINTSGRAVFFAGLTVCIALMGQFVLGLPFLYGLAVCASLTVLLTMLAAITLLPAFLGFFGTKVLSRRERRLLRSRGPEDEHASGAWYRWARFIQHHPVAPAVIATAVVVLVALPVLTLRLGLDDAGSDPPGSTTLQAYQLLSKGFGPGFAGPFVLVGKLPSPGAEGAFASVTRQVAGQPGVAQVAPPVVSPDGRVAIATLYPSSSPQSVQTSSLLHRLRGEVLPRATAGTGVTVLVGGTTALQTDFAHTLSSKLLLFLGVVVLLGFVLLMAVFRSLLIPLIASVMNLLSVGAALGILNAVFEWGYGASFFRIPEKAPVEVFLPVMLISILFGLSMDYEVFLVSRMREEWVRRRHPSESVAVGQAATGRVITAAAAIMILVFASFAFGSNAVIKQFGIGLAGAILIDAFIVRTVLVPALMHLFGRANWWLPAWLDRILPQLNVEGVRPEGEGPPPPSPEPVLVRSGG
ncbi:MAG TPA: MMPL family transporter [Acidimicrobiales bacterium]|nr:MMPL family transporter [Acidimicrobiales bacterium]